MIFMSGHGDVPLAVEAMSKGAVTFLEKPFREAALEAALKKAFASLPTPSPEQDDFQQRLSTLTERERQVMDLVVGGDVNKVIAYKLGISPKTVELHRSRIMTKMGASNVSNLVRMAVAGRVDGAR